MPFSDGPVLTVRPGHTSGAAILSVIEKWASRAVISLVLLAACDPAASITVENHCPAPVWVRYANSAEGLETWTPKEVKPGETVETQTVGAGGAASVSDSAASVGRVFPAEDGDRVVLKDSLCPPNRS